MGLLVDHRCRSRRRWCWTVSHVDCSETAMINEYPHNKQSRATRLFSDKGRQWVKPRVIGRAILPLPPPLRPFLCQPWGTSPPASAPKILTHSVLAILRRPLTPPSGRLAWSRIGQRFRGSRVYNIVCGGLAYCHDDQPCPDWT